MSLPAYDALLAHVKTSAAIGKAASLATWDQEVMMPPKGAAARAETAGALQGVLHARATDPKVGEWLDTCEAATADLPTQAPVNLDLIRRSYVRDCRVPGDLTEALAKLTSQAHRTWAEARAANDFATFAPTLTQVIAMTREMGEALRDPDQTLYDALGEGFETGTTEAETAAIFDELRAGLVPLRAEIGETWAQAPGLQGSFPSDAQMALSRDIAAAMGYDFDAGRLDLSVHPFTNGADGDCRITTRVATGSPFDCLYSTIHEVGHALYAQGGDPALEWEPAGADVSMGVHESQSRFWENQVGRSRAFADYVFPKLTAAFGDIGVSDADGYYRAANRVAPGFIRTEADEIHYNLHIMMRFDLERALMSGDLTVPDLPGAWNDRFQADFGIAIPSDTLGCLQDVHWSAGLFGYFPTYALGNIYAACLDKAMLAEMPDRDALVRTGDFAPILDWMRTRIHRRGSMLKPRALIEEATGAAPDAQALIAYLRAKFLG